MPLRVGQKIQAVPRQAGLIRLDVVAGILRDASGRVLITERVDDGPFHGLWEFPGGKIAPGEAPEAALLRELEEEVGVQPLASELFMRLEHDYPDQHVAIRFYLVTGWRNEPAGLEGQQLKWVAVTDLADADLLPADKPVIAALQEREAVAARQLSR